MSEDIRRRQESRSPSGNTLPKSRFGPDLDAGWKSLTQSAGLRVENPGRLPSEMASSGGQPEYRRPSINAASPQSHRAHKLPVKGSSAEQAGGHGVSASAPPSLVAA